MFPFIWQACDNSDNVEPGGDIVTPDIMPIVKTGLPVLYINMQDSLNRVTKDKYLKGCTFTVTDSSGFILYCGGGKIKGRGNSTWERPKKPFNISLDEKASLFNMPANKKWCLLANWYDRTLLRNALAFEIARRLKMEWASHGEWVELVVNGEYQGNYYLCEKIEVDSQRVNIEKTNDEEFGSYIIEIDNLFDEKNKFKSIIFDLPYMIKYPDDDKLTEGQFNYIMDYINKFESSLSDSACFASREYTKYIDIYSFIDFWLVYEICCCLEPVGPRSCYMYKDKYDKLKAGPVWDFDLQTFKPTHYTGSFPIKKTLYYGQLFQDPVFEKEVKNRWNLNKSALNDINLWIDSKAQLLYQSQLLNFEKWPMGSKLNGDEDMDFFQAIESMKEGLRLKLDYMQRMLAE